MHVHTHTHLHMPDFCVLMRTIQSKEEPMMEDKWRVNVWLHLFYVSNFVFFFKFF